MTTPRGSVNFGPQTMLILRGSPALSNFRLQKLRQELTGAGVPVSELSAIFVHVAETERELDAKERSILEQLLTDRKSTRLNSSH